MANVGSLNADRPNFWDAPNFRDSHWKLGYKNRDDIILRDSEALCCGQCHTEYSPIKHKDEKCYYHPGKGELAPLTSKFAGY